jgi:hypothetical protein
MDRAYFFDVLYALQDEVLAVVGELETDFYLTGGTAASRGYLQHRLSEDLDFFVNDAADFGLWAQRLIDALGARVGWQVRVGLRESRFIRLAVLAGDISLKIELVNDVPAHVGEIRRHPILGRLDSAENILANKVTAALDRAEPKDCADIWGFCCQRGLQLDTAIEDARSKAAGVFPADLARVLLSVTEDDWRLVRWITAPPAADYLKDLHHLGERLLLPG